MWNKTFHIISLIIGVSALCLAYLRCEPLEKDWLGILVGILSLLVTVLLGTNIYTLLDLKKEWSVYKEHTREKLSVIDKLNDKVTDDRFRNKMALDANVNLMQGEIYATSKLYLLAYREYVSSLVRFNESGDTDLQEQIINKLNFCIRKIRMELGRNGYILDWDFEDDVFHYKNVSRIKDSPSVYTGLNITEMERLIKYLSYKSDYIKILNYKFTLFRDDAEIKDRGFSIYALFKKEGDAYKHYNKVYADYNSFMNEIMNDLNGEYDLIGVCENGIDEFEKAIDDIKSCSECDYVKDCTKPFSNNNSATKI